MTLADAPRTRTRVLPLVHARVTLTVLLADGTAYTCVYVCIYIYIYIYIYIERER